MKSTYLAPIALILAVAGLTYFRVSPTASLSLLAGGALTLLNFAVLGLTWFRILAKKQVALSLSVIVFKFAILGWIIYEVVHSETISTGWFAVGMGLAIFGVTGMALLLDVFGVTPSMSSTGLTLSSINSTEKAEV